MTYEEWQEIYLDYLTDDYGHSVIYRHCFGISYFYALQENWRYHC